MYEVRAAMTTMLNQIAQQAALLKVAGTLTRSADIMSSLNSIFKTAETLINEYNRQLTESKK